ncbi:NADPH2:quinone reductase [Allocatelliglobosispora scoriae]|uniref:NADPH2:quinone reductase n=1 Tax=Allocatelliglobosispora scoriae TaxID=643052 RepID=A0A841BSE5_9ACTN|nr:quinone oxidoreductase [Allocatelliglobosispora scoriae]MBB5869720.1 NADPH2:quinone reductase [Allocatelliglobosispora scoriae]
MRAIQITEPGGPEVLVATEVDAPQPGPGEVAVEITAAGVNFIDIYHREGRYPVALPYIPGVEAAGRVADLGPGVTGLAVGDRVGWVSHPGGYAERAVVPAKLLVPLPDGVDDETAAGVLLQGMTAHALTHDVYPVRPGDAILVHAAAGGMGLLLTQLITHLGGRVIGTTSTAAKEELARAAGAAEVIRYTEVDDLAAEVRRLTGGRGVAAVYDGVGAQTFDASLASLHLRGTLALFGGASGPVPPFDPMRLMASGSISLIRPTLGHFIVEREELLRRSSDVLGWVADKTLAVSITERYPLAEAARAHTDLAGRRTTGKLLLLP